MSPESLEEALHTLGELLEHRGFAAEVVVVGGGSLLLLGLLHRPTRDLDMIAIVRNGVYERAEPLPEYLRQAVADTGDALGLSHDWLNPGPTSLLDLGLPEGFSERAEARRYRTLTLQLASRFDQICFKLYATTDQGPRSKHAADLRILAPSMRELRAAAAWCRSHDPSEAFNLDLTAALAAFGSS